jgi:hypothetical protein
MLVGGRLKKESGGVDGSATDSDYVAKVGGESRWSVDGAVMLDFDRGDSGAGRICNDTRYLCFSEECHVGEVHDLADAVDVGVGFGVNETGVAVAGVAADAFGFDRIGGIALEAERDGERVVAEFLDVVVDGLHAGFAGECRKRIGLGMERFGGIGTAQIIVEIPVGGEEFFGASVVRLEVGIGERPGGRDAALVVENTKVFGAKPEEGSAIDFCLAADEVGLLGVERLIVLVEPDVFGVVAIVEEDGGGVPVEFFLREERAALENENALPSLCEMEGESATTSPTSDNDGVILIGHEVLSEIEKRIG